MVTQLRRVTPFRIAAVLLVFFFAGHTFGGMLSQPSMGAASDTVFESMKAVQFQFHGFNSTWYGFWFGFGLMASVYLLTSVVVAWQLEKVPPQAWPAVSPIAWAFAASYVATAILSWKYFFAGPGTIGTLVALLLIVGTLRKGRAAAAA